MVFFFAFPGLAQAPPLQWQACLGGTNDDNANDICQTRDGGYIMVGSTLSDNGDVLMNHGFVDYWVVKLDAGGAMQWQKTFGGSKSDVAYSVQQTNDGDLL